MNPDVRTILENTEQKGNALLLLILIAEGGDTRLPTLARHLGVTARQVRNLVYQCEAAGDLIVRPGQGRGHASEYEIPYLQSDKKGKSVSSFEDEEKGKPAPSVTPTPSGKGNSTPPLSDEKRKPTSPLPEKEEINFPVSANGKGETPTPPHTPHRDNYISLVEANASTATSAVSLKSFVGGLLQFRESDLGSKLPNHKMEAAAAKWLFEQQWTLEDSKACYQFLKAQKWRETPVTLKTVMSSIGDWKKGNLTDERDGNGTAKRGGRRDDAPRRSAAADRQPHQKWGFKNSAGG